MIINIRNKNIYIEEEGKEASQPVLYIHGGPGGIGSETFNRYQMKGLSKNFRVIAPDQRGVWRSEEVKENEALELEDMIEDFEEIRMRLHIKQWSLLTHSFGGYLAVLYANKYPHSLNKIVFENPSFDFSLSERCILLHHVNRLEEAGRDVHVYREAMEETGDYHKISGLLGDVSRELDSRAEDIMWYGKNTGLIDEIAMYSENAAENWAKSTSTRIKLLKDDRLYHDIFDLLSNIRSECLLLKGQKDPITCPVQLAEFRNRVSQNEIAVFQYSGHWIHIEERDFYRKTVTRFLKKPKKED